MPKRLPAIEFTADGAAIGDEFVALRPRQRDILEVLAKAAGDVIPAERIITTIWPDPDDEPEAACVAVRRDIHMLRGRIRPAGLVIRNEPRAGYRLAVEGTARHAMEDVDRLALRLGVPRSPAARLCRDAGASATAILKRIGQPGGRKRGGPYGRHSRPA